MVSAQWKSSFQAPLMPCTVKSAGSLQELYCPTCQNACASNHFPILAVTIQRVSRMWLVTLYRHLTVAGTEWGLVWHRVGARLVSLVHCLVQGPDGCVPFETAQQDYLHPCCCTHELA